MKKAAIIGRNSFIAQCLAPAIASDYEVIFLSSRAPDCVQLDLRNNRKFDYSFFENIDYLIFLAAVSSPDKCEKEYEDSYAVNVSGTQKVIEEAARRGCKVLFFSSDAVYGHDSGKAFVETDPCCPFSAYGIMKRAVECAFEGSTDIKVLRLSYVFSYYDKFTQYYLNTLRQGGTPEIFHPFYRNVICIDELAHLVKVVLRDWNMLPMQIINACGRELISRVEIADIINRYANLPENSFQIVSMSEEFKKVRPLITEMHSLYLGDMLEELDQSFSERAFCELSKHMKKGELGQ